jgi:hypothetical protein
MAKKSYPPRNLNKKRALIDLLIHELKGRLAIVTTGANNLLRNWEREGPLTEDPCTSLTMG